MNRAPRAVPLVLVLLGTAALFVSHLSARREDERRAPPSREKKTGTHALALGLVVAMALVWGHRAIAQSRSWGMFGGKCFEVVETGAPGCEASYADGTTVALQVQ